MKIEITGIASFASNFCPMCGSGKMTILHAKAVYLSGERFVKTEDILGEREKTHGDFERVPEMAQALKRGLKLNTVRVNAGLEGLSAAQTNALEMICLKLARIVCGDPSHADHWDDIAGYAMLGKGREEPTEFEKEYCVPLGKEDGQIHFYTEGATRPKEDYQLKEEGINSRCRVCNKEISKDTSICYWCAVNEGTEKEGSKMQQEQNVPTLIEEKPKCKCLHFGDGPNENSFCFNCSKPL